MPQVSAILTAAGESTRMGRPKPLLPMKLEERLLEKVQSKAQAGEPIAVGD